ncbi:MAG: hypothetical protein U0136_05465 [Bdellovibrionota bacterium]
MRLRHNLTMQMRANIQAVSEGTSPCLMCRKSFPVDADDKAFLERLSPVIGGERYDLPKPEFCPQCRLQTRLAFRNQMYVYKRLSSMSGNPIFSMIPASAPFPVYSKEEWWSDRWDPTAYGREFSRAKPFFDQFRELQCFVPAFPLSVLNSENSDYCNNVTGARNCYLVFNTSFSEDCMCCESVWRSKDCLDCSFTPESELCYDCTECAHCYALQSSQHCENCSESFFLMHCQGCRNCFGCVNLRRKEYCIFNRQVSKQEYTQFISDASLSSSAARARWGEQAHKLFLQHPRPHIESRFAEECTGNQVFQSRGVKDGYLIRGAENCRYVFNTYPEIRDCCDYSCFGNGAELLYECCTCGSGCSYSQFCTHCWDGSANLHYCIMCIGCQECFGCVGLRRKQYCILNKQYSKAEYEQIVPGIIAFMRTTGEWGRFFPRCFAPVPYNESLAQRYFPLTAEVAAQQELWWEERPPVTDERALPASALPDGLPRDDRPITALSQLSGKPFRIPTEEIRRCRAMNVPLPRMSYDERLNERARMLGGLELYSRPCARSGKDLATSFPPDSPWIIWDRDLYENEISS